ncbi:MAG: MFS transporter [Chloroflexota bacterium]|nr:MFS transporter [Chloroflexota bacterium]
MSRRSWTLVAVVLGTGIVFLDSTVVNVALSAIGRELPSTLVATLEGQSYVVYGYLLSLSALLILAGSLADLYGRRRMFLLGLGGFGISSVLCGVAPNMELLILFRLVQGAFGALLVPTSLAIITATFEGPERGRAFGIWAAASGATTLLGPPLGGFLVDAISWRAVFLINVPLVLVALYAGAAHVVESRDRDAEGRFDFLGAAVVAIAVGGLSFGAIRGQEQQWSDPIAWIALAVGAVAMALVPPLMILRPNPLVPPELFKSRNFTVVNISTLLIYGALYVYGYLQAVFVQGALQYTALAAGLVGLPISILLTFFSTSVGTIAGRYGPRWFMTIGPALMAAGLFWLVRIPADSTPWRASLAAPATLVPPVAYLVDFLPGALVFAIGLTCLVAPLTTALMSSVPERNSGLASAINNAISRVGPLVAGALIFVAVTASFYGGLKQRVPSLNVDAADVRRTLAPLNPPKAGVPASVAEAARESSADAFHLAMAIAASLCLAGAVANGIGIQNPAESVASAEGESARGAAAA